MTRLACVPGKSNRSGQYRKQMQHILLQSTSELIPNLQPKRKKKAGSRFLHQTCNSTAAISGQSMEESERLV